MRGDDAPLNAPVGKLVDLLMVECRKGWAQSRFRLPVRLDQST